MFVSIFMVMWAGNSIKNFNKCLTNIYCNMHYWFFWWRESLCLSWSWIWFEFLGLLCIKICLQKNLPANWCKNTTKKCQKKAQSFILSMTKVEILELQPYKSFLQNSKSSIQKFPSDVPANKGKIGKIQADSWRGIYNSENENLCAPNQESIKQWTL